MVDIMDRRVTRSLSNELAARQAAAAQQAASHSYVIQSSYHVQNHRQQQHINVVGQGYQPHPQQQRHQEPSSGGINHHHQQQQQQSPVGMNGGGLGSSMGGGPTYPRTTSEEMFLHTLMNTALSPGTPTMEAASLGFLDTLQPQPAIPNTLRGNSEELFTSWLSTTPENSNQFQNSAYSGPSSNGNRPRHSPRQRRVSSELQAIIAQQNGTTWAPRADNVEQAYMQTNSYLPNDIIQANVNNDQKPYRPNPPEDKSGPGDYGNASSLKNIWFNATSPMTRSRSSEMRRRYAETEGLAVPPPVDVIQKLATQGTLEGLVHPAMASMGTFTRGVGSIGNDGRPQNSLDSTEMGSQAPTVPTLSTSAPVNHKQQMQQQQSQQQQVHQQPAATNALTDVVGLLKGSLERKKLQTKQQQQQLPPQHQQIVHQRQMPPQQQEPQHAVRSRPTQEPQQEVGSRQRSMSGPQINAGVRARQDESLDKPQDHGQHLHGDSGMEQSGQVQQNSGMLRVRSPDESSCGAPAPSHSGIATSDGPSNSAMSVHRQALKRGGGSGAVDQPLPKRQQALSGIDSGPCIGENRENGVAKSDLPKKPDQLARAGSITSSLRNGFQLNELDGDTRKRRVERQRKMAEAKGRGNAPPMPADMQAAVKRCEALEKEVRSLKLNLSFMNRKDSEQTKKIEELEQQNDELKEERDRLLDELDRPLRIHD